MSEAQRVNEVFRKIAALECRIHKLEYGRAEFDAVIVHQSWMGNASERFKENLKELSGRFDAIFEAMHWKIDIIWQHITLMSQSSED